MEMNQRKRRDRKEIIIQAFSSQFARTARLSFLLMLPLLFLLSITPSLVSAQGIEPPDHHFTTRFLRTGVEGTSYINNSCQYLHYQWGPGRAEPGTVVLPIMFHSITKPGRTPQENTAITAEYWAEIVRNAKNLGFETITTDELIQFLKYNAPIPPRSMIFIVDDRRLGVVEDHFMPVLEENDWTVTLAYITGVATDAEWEHLAKLDATGRIDVQAHGFLHNGSTYITEFTPGDVIEQEIKAPIHLIQEHLGSRPLAFIWPGGNFTSRAVNLAVDSGYQVGFTAYSRGPLMFNWIPLGEAERAMLNPLMVLPRAWSTAAYVNLEEAAAISGQYMDFLENNKITELLYYYNECSGIVPDDPNFPSHKME